MTIHFTHEPCAFHLLVKSATMTWQVNTDWTGAGNTMNSYMCVICGFVYEEAKGLPDQGIPPGTRWEDVPDTWVCPDCVAGKDEFEMVKI
jgi:rubredoxin